MDAQSMTLGTLEVPIGVESQGYPKRNGVLQSMWKFQ